MKAVAEPPQTTTPADKPNPSPQSRGADQRRKGAYWIASFDGGGIRGVLSAVLYQRLLEAVPALAGRINLYAGTSTGSIMALGLAARKTPAELVNLYRGQGREIFQDTMWDDLVDLGNLIGAQYGSKGLRAALYQVFGTLRLGGLWNNVLVPAFDLAAADGGPWRPKFFSNLPKEDDQDGRTTVVDVAMASCAAPTYFPAYNGYIDGGMVANNPSMSAVAATLAGGSAVLGDIRVLSFGTGTTHTNVKGNPNWGVAQWGKVVPHLMIDGVGAVADYQCAWMLGGNYHRINPQLDKPVKLDDWRAVEYLYDQACDTSLGHMITRVKGMLAMEGACDVGNAPKG